MRIPFLFWGITLMGGLAAHAQTPNNIEAVEYDPGSDRWFVSNGSSLLVTGDLGQSWSAFGEAEASHGMEVVNGVLYAIGNNVIRAYDLNDVALLGTLAIPGVGFLNGMGNNGSNQLVISDFSGGRLYTVDISDPSSMTYGQLTGNLGETPNGVVVDMENNRAIVVCWGNNADILAVDLESGEVSVLVDGTGLGNLDGIDNDGEGHYYVSSWSPNKVTRYNADFSVGEPVLGPADGLSSPADISYAQETGVLGIANSGSDEVTFHNFGESTNGVSHHQSWSVRHVGDQLVFHLPSGQPVKWSGFDIGGRLVFDRQEWLPSGTVSIPWPLENTGGVVLVEVGGNRQALR